MGRTVGTAMQYESLIKPRVSASKRVSRSFVAKGMYKSIDKLNDRQVALYLLRRYHVELLMVLVFVQFAVIIWSKLG